MLGALTGAATNNVPTPVSLIGAGNITLSGNVTSNSTTAAGGLALLESPGSASIEGIDVSGVTGGFMIVSAPDGITLPDGSSLIARSSGNAGNGGSILLAGMNGPVNLGVAGNSSGNTIDVSGQTGGMVSILSGEDENGYGINDYEVSVLAKGTSVSGGSILLESIGGPVQLYNEWSTSVHYNANLDASATTGFGGSITMIGPQAANILRDSTVCCTGSSTGVVNVNGGVAGGTVSVNSAFSSVNIQAGTITAEATNAAGSIGGLVSMSSGGGVTSCGINVSGANGGTINVNAAAYLLMNGSSLNANGSAGDGGIIRISGPVDIEFGTRNNQTNNTVSANGTLGGGLVDLVSGGGPIYDFETSISANSTAGQGGEVRMSAFGGAIYLYQTHPTGAAYNSSIDVSSSNGAGGEIYLLGQNGVDALLDTNGSGTGAVAAVINANGTTQGGTIVMVTTYSGNVSLADMSAVEANASSGVGGNIFVANFGSGLVTSNVSGRPTVPLSATGTTEGGAISVVSDGTITLSAVNAQATASGGLGGAISISSIGNLSTGALNASASGSGSSGGKILITTAQPASGASGTTLTTSSTASGTISVSSYNISGASNGTTYMYTSGGAAITGGVGATTSQTKSVLPENFSSTGSFTITPDLLPGGGFTSFSNTGTLDLSNFGRSGLALAVTPNSASLGTLNASAQSFTVLTGGALSYSAINTSSSTASGGSVGLYSLSSAANTINGGSINTSSSSSTAGTSAGYIVVEAPYGNFTGTGAMNASGSNSAAFNSLFVFAGNGITLLNSSNATNLSASAITMTSTDSAVSATIQSQTGTISGIAGTNYSLAVNSGAVVTGNILAGNGSIYIDRANTSGTTTITESANSALFANNGNVTIENDYTSTGGSITIGTNVSIVAFTSQKPTAGNVSIVMGSVPTSPVTGSQPGNVNVATSEGGQIYWGQNGITANSPTNNVSAIGTNIIFNTGSLSASAITLNGGVTITADPPSQLAPVSPQVVNGYSYFSGLDNTPNPGINPQAIMVSNLDLTNVSNVAQLSTWQLQGQLAGSLQVANGDATGGTLVVTPSQLASNITGHDIPAQCHGELARLPGTEYGDFRCQ